MSALLKFNLFLLEVVDVGALGSHSLEVNISRNSASGDLGELSVNIEGEGAKLADIDRLSLAEVVVEVGDKSSPDDHHLNLKVRMSEFIMCYQIISLNTYLGFGFEGFLVRIGSLGGAVMFARVLVSILENPKHKNDII